MNNRPRLIVIDDERQFAEFVRRVADELGYETAVATTQQEFEREYERLHPDVIVTDVVMPGRDGIETIRWLASNGCTARILVVSGYNPMYANVAQVLGTHDGLMNIAKMNKPVKMTDLQAYLSREMTAWAECRSSAK